MTEFNQILKISYFVGNVIQQLCLIKLPIACQLLTFLLYGSEKFAFYVNKEIIRLTISYLKASERFVQPLF